MKKMRLVPLITTVFALAAGKAMATQLWEIKTDDGVGQYDLVSDVVVVNTDKSIYGISREDGRELWRINAEMHETRHEVIPYTQLALVCVSKDSRDPPPGMAMISLDDGRYLWTSESNGLMEIDGWYLVAHKQALFVYGKKEGENKKAAMLLDLYDGSVIWSIEDPFKKWEPELFGNGAQFPLFDSEDTMILLLNKKSIRKYSLNNGQLVWETKGLKRRKKRWIKPEEVQQHLPDRAPVLSYGYAPMLFDSDRNRFYAPYHNTVGAFDPTDGHLHWDETEMLQGFVTQMAILPQGLLVKTTPEIDTDTSRDWLVLLDYTTGKKIWEAPRREGSLLRKFTGTWKTSSHFFLVDDHRAVLVADNELVSVDLASGHETRLAKIDFKSEDYVRGFEVLPDGYLITGSQNAMWYGLDGELRKHVYYYPPDNFGVGLAFLGAAATFNAIGTFEIGGVKIAIRGNYGYGLERMLEEFTATAHSRSYIHILADSDEGPELVRISKESGDVEGRILVGSKKPKYRVCPYTGNLYLRPDDTTIQCLSFD